MIHLKIHCFWIDQAVGSCENEAWGDQSSTADLILVFVFIVSFVVVVWSHGLAQVFWTDFANIYPKLLYAGRNDA